MVRAETSAERKILDDWLSEKEAAAAVGKTVRTLRQWRKKGEGPPFAYFGRTVRYHGPAFIRHFESTQVVPVRARRRG